MKNNSKKIISIILFCSFLGLCERLFHLIEYPVIARDSYIYYNILKEWNETGTIAQGGTTPPLALFLFRIPSLLFNYDIIKGGIIINVLLGELIVALAIIISYTIRKNYLFNLTVGILTSTHPTLVHYSCQMTRETSYLAFIEFSCLFLIIFIKRQNIFYIILSGLFSAIAYSCRHEALELIPIALFAIISFTHQKTFLRYAKEIFTYLFSFMVTFVSIPFLIGIPICYYKGYYIEFLSKCLVIGQ